MAPLGDFGAAVGHPATAPVEYFREAVACHRRAVAVAGTCARFYSIAGHCVCLRFAGMALVSALTRALGHLETAPVADPALTVRLWDSESTGTVMPAPAWGADDYREHGKIRGFFDTRVSAMFQWGSHALSMLDAGRDEAIYWIRSGRQLPYFERAAPLRTIFHLWFGRRGIQLVHAAAVGTETSGALLVGRAGAGKSTSALACLAAGLHHLADDYCLVAPGDPPVVHGLYSSAKLHADALARLPAYRAMVDNPDRPGYEKALCFLHERCADRLLTRSPLAAVLIPRITLATDTSLRTASAGAALAALGPSTILQLPGAGDDALRAMAAMARRVPAHHLDVGTDAAQLGRTVADLLARGR